MASEKKRSAAGDVGAWALNVFSSVGIIYVNKVVMSLYGFRFATTLTAMHFGVTALAGFVSCWVGWIKRKEIPLSSLCWFSLLANVSIVGMNLSLLLNSVGFYQIAKLSMIPVVCVMERVLNNKRYSRNVILAVVMVVFGVAIVTVTDVSINFRGFVTAAIAVLATALQQILIGSMQTTYSVNSFELLSKTAPIQAAFLIPLGPFVDIGLSGQWVFDYKFTTAAICYILLSCALAVGCNVSQYLVIGRFSAVSFQVLGHMKTLCVLTMGWLFFYDIISLKNVLGMLITVMGIVFYGWAAEQSKAQVAPLDAKSVELSEEDVSLLKSGLNEHTIELSAKDSVKQ